MSVDSRFEGGFKGTHRQGVIHYRLFSLLTGYDGKYKHRNGFVENNTEDNLVFSWLTDVNGWESVDELVFISIARALPKANFRYYTYMKEEVGGGDESINDIEFTNGSFLFRSYVVYADEIKYSANCPYCGWRLILDEHEAFQETYECPKCGEDIQLNRLILEEDDENFFDADLCEGGAIKIDRDGNVVGDEKYLEECIEFETDSLLRLLELIETGTDDPTLLLDLGMLYETGLAGVQKNLTIQIRCFWKL